jgi:phage gp46-like protein
VLRGEWLSFDLAATGAPDRAAINANAVTGARLAARDAPDRVAFFGRLVNNAQLEARERPDGASFLAGNYVVGDLNGKENPDRATIAGGLVSVGRLVGSERADTAAIASHLSTSGQLVAADIRDRAGFSGTAFLQLFASLVAKENPDVVSIFTERGLSAAGPSIAPIGTVAIGISGWRGEALSLNLIASDAPDRVAITGRAATSAQLAATDTPDRVAIAGRTITNARLVATDTPDRAAFAARVSNNGRLEATERQDGAAFLAGNYILVALAAAEAPDRAIFAGAGHTTGTLVAVDSPDRGTFVGGSHAVGILVAREVRDRAAITGRVDVSGGLFARERPDTVAIYSSRGLSTAGTSVAPIGTLAIGLLKARGEALSADLVATEFRDSAAIVGRAINHARLEATERPDGASFFAGNVIAVVLAGKEAPDRVRLTGLAFARLFGDLAATDSPDTAAIYSSRGLSAAGPSVAPIGTVAIGLLRASTETLLLNLAATEVRDGAVLAAQAVNNARLAATERQDGAAFFAGNVIVGALTGTEAPDRARFIGLTFARLFGDLAATDRPDTARIYSSRGLSTAGAGIAPIGTFAIATLGWSGEPLSLNLAATETQDTAQFVAGGIVTGRLLATEARDRVAIVGSTTVPAVFGVLAARDSPDVAAFTSTRGISVAGALVEPIGTVAIGTLGRRIEAPVEEIIGAFVAIEPRDRVAIVGDVSVVGAPIFGNLAARDRPDTASFTTTEAVFAAGAGVGLIGTFAIGTLGKPIAAPPVVEVIYGDLAARDSRDIASFYSTRGISAAGAGVAPIGTLVIGILGRWLEPLSLRLAATEPRDRATIVGDTYLKDLFVNLAAIEAQDRVRIFGGVAIDGQWTAAERSDRAIFRGGALWPAVGDLVATEQPDIILIEQFPARLLATENPDRAAFHGERIPLKPRLIPVTRPRIKIMDRAVDIRLVQDATFPNGTGILIDWQLLDNGTLDDTQALATAMVVALGTDHRADAGEALPDPDNTDRRGWWGDMDAETVWNGWPIGSKLWLLKREKITGPEALQGSTLVRVENYIRQAVQPFIERRIGSQMYVEATRHERERIDALVRLYRGPVLEIELRYSVLWTDIMLSGEEYDIGRATGTWGN